MDLDALTEYKITNSLAIRNKLVTDNVALVHHVAWIFTKRRRPSEDLVQAGIIGLMHAIDKFDISRITYDARNGASGANLFKAFATWHILHELQKACANDAGMSKRLRQQEWTKQDLYDVLTGFVRELTFVRNASHQTQFAHDTEDGGPNAERYQDDGHESQAQARVDLMIALCNATPDDIDALVALADGATPAELATALGMPPGRGSAQIATERANAARERALAALDGRDAPP